ncbi:ribokinase [Anaerovorax odorimutans]|uniref:ribokinase n=1 Tax=Anaerovorax odorimutans TaxID=109327 RepID=UPI0004168E46|nr:ribokinase [Anaerovorax odorimutans]
MITVVGSLNMDLVFNADKIPRPGETVLGKNFQQIPGGKGGNQADTIAKLGEKVNMIGCIGTDDLGFLLKKLLEKDGVDVTHILEKNHVATGTAVIIVESSGDNCITVAPGANYTLTPSEIKNLNQIITDSQLLLVQLENKIDAVKAALKIAKKSGIKTILNPAPAVKLNKEMLMYADILTPNETELEILSDMKTDSLKNIEKAGKKLISKGANELVVTLGEKGCMYISKNRVEYFPAYKVKVIDTTAAGDSFNGALAVYLSQNKTIDEAILFAMKVSAITVTKPGAQISLPNIDEVNKFHTWIHVQGLK